MKNNRLAVFAVRRNVTTVTQICPGVRPLRLFTCFADLKVVVAYGSKRVASGGALEAYGTNRATNIGSRRAWALPKVSLSVPSLLATLRIFAAIVPAATTGCLSISYVDKMNIRHVIGFVDLALPTASGSAEPGAPSAHAVTVTGVGLSIHTQPGHGSSLVVGYSKQTVVSAGDNGCVDLGQPGPCANPRASLSSPPQSARRQK